MFMLRNVFIRRLQLLGLEKHFSTFGNLEEAACVKIAQGTLRGRKINSEIAGTYYSFLGIPYAEPPVGPLRFKPPIPAANWEGIRDALTEGPVCPQFDEQQKFIYVGDEDCLYVNVHTPQIPSDMERGNLPVMVYIHGGGFYCGYGDSKLYGPDYIISQNVILVTLNYRLGAFGFLSTGDSVVPGNIGLKDQVLALKWVQKNIQQFGGDKKNVTIFGNSAGAGCVHLHVVSPMSKGLFHKAISQSGCALNPWACENTSVARHKAFRFGETLGIKTTDSKELVEFLNNIPAKQFVEKVADSLPDEEKHPFPLCFLPTTDNKSTEDEVFMPDRPENLISQGKFQKIPYIIGVTSNEGIFVLRDVHANPSHFDTFREPIPNDLLISNNKEKYNEACQRIKNFFIDSKSTSKERWQGYADVFSDMWFIYGITRCIKLLLSVSPEPIYFYRFAFDKKQGTPESEHAPHTPPGVCHAEEVFFLFLMNVNENQKKPDKESLLTTRRMARMWTNFAKTGNPTPEEDPLLGLIWEPVTSKSELKYINIDRELTMKKGLAAERLEFWDNLYAWLHRKK